MLEVGGGWWFGCGVVLVLLYGFCVVVLLCVGVG